MLCQAAGTVVFLVAAEFVAELAALTPPDRERVATDRGRCAELQRWDEPDLRAALDQVADLAGRATRLNLPLIELALIG